MDIRFILSDKKDEISLYNETDFVNIFVDDFKEMTFVEFNSFKKIWGNWLKISTKTQHTIEKVLRFIEWARDFSPALTPIDFLSKEQTIPSDLDTTEINSLSIEAKNNIFIYLFQRRHNRGSINCSLLIELFSNPAVMYDSKFIDQAVNGDISL